MAIARPAGRRRPGRCECRVPGAQRHDVVRHRGARRRQPRRHGGPPLLHRGRAVQRRRDLTGRDARWRGLGRGRAWREPHRQRRRDHVRACRWVTGRTRAAGPRRSPRGRLDGHAWRRPGPLRRRAVHRLPAQRRPEFRLPRLPDRGPRRRAMGGHAGGRTEPTRAGGPRTAGREVRIAAVPGHHGVPDGRLARLVDRHVRGRPRQPAQRQAPHLHDRPTACRATPSPRWPGGRAAASG